MLARKADSKSSYKKVGSELMFSFCKSPEARFLLIIYSKSMHSFSGEVSGVEQLRGF
jgi:hypothetical protein